MLITPEKIGGYYTQQESVGQGAFDFDSQKPSKINHLIQPTPVKNHHTRSVFKHNQLSRGWEHVSQVLTFIKGYN
jgi:hypothetical protein